MTKNLHLEIIEMLSRAAELGIERAGMKRQQELLPLYEEVAAEFVRFFGIFGLEPGDPKREQLESLLVKTMWGLPGYCVCHYPAFADVLLGEIDWPLFAEENHAPSAPLNESETLQPTIH